MVGEMKRNFFPMDYALNFLRRLHILKQLKMSVKEYMEDFYKLSVRSG